MVAALDRKNAYVHIHVDPSHRKFLYFIGQEHYQFHVLACGLATAPRVFTKVFTVVTAQMQYQGYTVFPCLDD